MNQLPVSQNGPLLDEWRKTLGNEVVHSPFTPFDIPTETLLSRILRALQCNAERHPDKAAVIEGFNQDRRLTYRQIHDQSLSMAFFLRSRGFGVGARSMAMLPNCVELPVIHLGIWAAGGLYVGARSNLTHYETVYQIQDSGSSVIFAAEEELDMVMEAVEECPAVKTIVCIRSSLTPLPAGVFDFTHTLDFPKIDEIVEVTMDTPCVVMYSSGTSGLPKGVVHTHRSCHCVIETIRSHFQYEIYPVLGLNNVDLTEKYQIIATPVNHFMGFVNLNWWLATGSPIILLNRLDETRFPQILTQFKPRYLSLTPPMFAYLAKHPFGVAASLDSVQMVLCCSAPPSQEISEQLLAHHPSVKYIVQGYGLTETGATHLPMLLREGATASSGIIVANSQQKIVVPGTSKSCKQGEWGEIFLKGPSMTVGYLNKPTATKELFDAEGWLRTGYGLTETGATHLPMLLREGATASSGIIVANSQQKIVVPGTSKSCKQGEWGEIFLKGPSMTVGYLNKPTATKELFDAEGWLRTGDIGYLDEFGCICIVDRVKELIQVNYKHQSIQISPAEIEGILLSHHKIRDVAVIGILHEDGGELARAFVVKADEQLDSADVEKSVADKLAPYKRLTGGVVFLRAIPRSASGKLLRRELRDKC